MTWEDRGPYFEAKAGEFWLRYGYYGSSRTSGYPAWWKVYDANMQLLAKGEAMGGKSAIKKASDEARNRGAKFSAGAQYASLGWTMAGGALVANAGAVTLRVKRGNEGHEWTVSEGGSVSKSGRQDSESAAKLAAESAARSLGAKFSDRSTMKYGVNWASVDPKWGGGETAHVNSDKGRWRLQAKQGKGGAWTWLADATHNLQKSRSGNATSVADAKAKAESAMMGSGEKFSDRSTTMTTTTKATPVLAFTAYAQAGKFNLPYPDAGLTWADQPPAGGRKWSKAIAAGIGQAFAQEESDGTFMFRIQSASGGNVVAEGRGLKSLDAAKKACEQAYATLAKKYKEHAMGAKKYGATLAWKKTAGGDKETWEFDDKVNFGKIEKQSYGDWFWTINVLGSVKTGRENTLDGAKSAASSAATAAGIERTNKPREFSASRKYAAWERVNSHTEMGVQTSDWEWYDRDSDVDLVVTSQAIGGTQWLWKVIIDGKLKKSGTSKSADSAKSSAEQAARAMGAKFADARQYADTTFTVYVKNLVLGSANFVGTFATQQEAEDYANTEASRSRKFVGFEVWTGTPQKYGKLVKVVREGVPQKQFTAKYSVTDQEFKILVPFLTGGGRARPLPAGQPIYDSLVSKGLIKKLPNGQVDITDAGKKVVHAQWEKDDPGMSTVTMRRASAAQYRDPGFLQYAATPTVVKPLAPRAVYTDGLMSGYAVCESASRPTDATARRYADPGDLATAKRLGESAGRKAKGGASPSWEKDQRSRLTAGKSSEDRRAIEDAYSQGYKEGFGDPSTGIHVSGGSR